MLCSSGEVCREVNERIVCSWEQKHLVLSESDFKFDLEVDDDLGPNVADYTQPIHPPRYTVKHPPLPEVGP